MATIQDVIRDFDRFERNLRFRADEIPYEIKTAVITEIVRTQSIDTTRFIQAVDFRETNSPSDFHRFVIDTSRNKEVTYDAIVELGRKKFAPYPGRYNYEHGIENADVFGVFDEIFDSSFR